MYPKPQPMAQVYHSLGRTGWLRNPNTQSAVDVKEGCHANPRTFPAFALQAAVTHMDCSPRKRRNNRLPFRSLAVLSPWVMARVRCEFADLVDELIAIFLTTYVLLLQPHSTEPPLLPARLFNVRGRVGVLRNFKSSRNSSLTLLVFTTVL